MSSNKIHAFDQNDALGHDDATAIAEKIRNKTLSVEEVTQAAIERCKRVNPTLDAIQVPFFDKPRQLKNQGFFYGVPTFIKDNTDIKGVPTRHGSPALNASPAKKDGALATQFLDQGFTLIGKTTLSEFGFSCSIEQPGGATTCNPWHTNHSAGGSSGGSAALVAAGAVPIAHGNDGGGSIRIPAACNGLVGLKPTRGRLVLSEASKILPLNIIGEGPLTRSVRDTVNFFTEAEKYYTNPKIPSLGTINPAPNKRFRIGVITDSITGFRTDDANRDTINATVKCLEALGHHVEPYRLNLKPQFIDDFILYYAMLAFLAEKATKVAERDRFDPSKLDSLNRGFIDHFKANFKKSPGMLYRLHRSKSYFDKEIMGGYDVIMSPVLAHEPSELGHLHPDHGYDTIISRLVDYAGFTPLANTSGAPAISLPMGISPNGLPIGMQFSTYYGEDKRLLELAFELEAAKPFVHLWH